MVETIVFGLLKPDCTKRGLVDIVIKDIEMYGFVIRNRYRRRLDTFDVFILYGHNRDKWFYKSLEEYMTIEDSVPFIAESKNGYDAIDTLKELVGYYIIELAKPNTIRKKYAIPNFFNIDVIQTIIHSSNNTDERNRELKHFFPEEYKNLNL